MKQVKVAATLWVTAFAVALPSVSRAAFTPVTKVTKTAVATLAGTGTVALSVTVRKTSDNTVDTNINWTGVALPAGFVVASDYIQLDSTITATGGGIQTYTDNTNGTPKFTGVIGPNTATPAGLVDSTDTTQKLPTAWTIQATTAVPVAIDPNAKKGTSFGWLYHEDKAQVAVASLGAGAFVNGDPYVTVKTTAGIHFGQSATEFGPAASPNYIFTEADFSAALTPRTYQTSTLTLEAFTQ